MEQHTAAERLRSLILQFSVMAVSIAVTVMLIQFVREALAEVGTAAGG